jgi:hypothetical protein
MFDEKQLPDWLKGFDLAKYESAGTLTPSEWADQILFRLDVDRGLDRKATANWSEVDEGDLQDKVQQLLISPVSHHGYTVKPLSQQRGAAERHIVPVSVFDLRNLLCQIDELNPPDVDLAGNSILRDEHRSADSYFVDSGLSRLADYCRITVDLTGNDGDIKRDFAAWLRTYRAAREKSSSPIASALINKAKRLDWHHHSILPHRDIQLLAAWNGIKKLPRQAHMRWAKGPVLDYDVESTIRRTRQKARMVFTWRIAHALSNLI